MQQTVMVLNSKLQPRNKNANVKMKGHHGDKGQIKRL